LVSTFSLASKSNGRSPALAAELTELADTLQHTVYLQVHDM
jgi:hypothetical protein